MKWQRSDTLSACAVDVALIAAGFQGWPLIQDWLLPEPDCSDASGLVRVRPVDANASSDLAPQGSFTYEAANIADDDLTTAWIPAGSDGRVGSQVTLVLPQSADVELLCIANGYVQTKDAYEKNGRVRDVTVTTSAGSATGALKDMSPDARNTFQEVPLEEGRTETVTITVNRYYAGVFTGRQDSHDTAVSEILVYSDGD